MSSRLRHGKAGGQLIRPLGAGLHQMQISTFRWIVAIAALTGLVYLIVHTGRGEFFATQIQTIDYVWLGAALISAVLTHVAAALVWKIASTSARPALDIITVLRIRFRQLLASRLLHGRNLRGMTSVLHALQLREVTRPRALFLVLLEAFSYYVAYLTLVLIAFVLFLHLHTDNFLFPISFTIIVISSSAFAALKIFAGLRKQALPPILIRWRPVAYFSVWVIEAESGPNGGKRTFAKAMLSHSAIFILDAVTLWCILHSLAIDIGLFETLTVSLIASLVEILAPLPFGLGIYEIISTVTLYAFGVSPQAALAATLLVRVVSVLPILPGLVLARRERSGLEKTQGHQLERKW